MNKMTKSTKGELNPYLEKIVALLKFHSYQTKQSTRLRIQQVSLDSSLHRQM